MIPSINITNPDDVVIFCNQRLDPKAVDKIIRANPSGLSEPEKITALLAEGKYISVLTAVWAERDRPKRLEWLRSNTGEHAPLMYELALAEYAASPTIATIESLSNPLIKAANMRVVQDAACIDDTSLGDAHMGMEMTYVRALINLIKKQTGETDPSRWAILDENKIAVALLARFEDLAKKTDRLPDPTWIASHGMGGFFGQINMHPADSWSIKRQLVVNKGVKDLSDRVKEAADKALRSPPVAA